MKKLLTAVAFAALALTANAQSADPKLEWATKVVTLQQGPELDRLVDQLAAGATQGLLQNWKPKLDALPKAKQESVGDQLNEELKKYAADVSGLITAKVKPVSNEALIPAYMEKFTLDELKQLAAFFESPAIKKYQATAPELGNAFVQKLVEATREDVLARSKQFDEVAGKAIGSSPAAKPPADTGKAKPPAKK